MSDYFSDLSALSSLAATQWDVKTTNSSAGSASLEMTDFLQLMVAQFQNQDPENAASTSDMLNQLVQMSVMQALNTVIDATTMLYSSSLVGKEVTVGQYDRDGKLQEIVGTVTGTGTYGGQPVIFVDGKSYYLSDIMAVGRLPEQVEEPAAPDGDDTDPDSTTQP